MSQVAIETVSDVRAVCECVECCVLVTEHARNALPFRHRFRQPALGCIGHHPISVELCSGLVKALATLDPSGFGLDDSSTPTRWDTRVGDPGACAQLEGSTYVMAEEARRIVSY